MKLTALAIMATFALTVSAQAFFGGCGDCCPKKPTCDNCPPTMETQRMEYYCGCGGPVCCPKLGFWYNNEYRGY